MVWGTYPEMKLLDRIILFLILEEPKYCFPTWPYHCTSPPAAYKDSNSSTSYPTRPPGALSYSLTQSFSKYLYKTYRTPEAGDTVRNKMDSACPWEACNLPRNRDSEQMTGGMNIKKKKGVQSATSMKRFIPKTLQLYVLWTHEIFFPEGTISGGKRNPWIDSNGGKVHTFSKMFNPFVFMKNGDPLLSLTKFNTARCMSHTLFKIWNARNRGHELTTWGPGPYSVLKAWIKIRIRIRIN